MKSRITQEMRLKVEKFKSSNHRKIARRLFRIDPRLTFWSIGKAEADSQKLTVSLAEAVTITNPQQ